ncbi:MAG TPA: XdhC family protein [Acidobacteriaceae bacterium]|nr:XdhC family protein [Acidobacteriaceae bacterium]
MIELRHILDLATRARAAGEEICLATVVAVEGSSYRRPGARMLITSAGHRAGTISGGCLEAEVIKKAWWLTAQGPSLQRYSSFFDDDGDMPYGLGCGGAIVVLLERGPAVERVLEALERSVHERTTSVIVSRLDPAHPGTELIANEAGETLCSREPNTEAQTLAHAALASRASQHQANFFAELVEPPPALFVFGAGDDAQPLVAFASQLGWHISVADGRAHLARPERFPQAARVGSLREILDAPGPHDAVTVMTHSYEQDREILRALLPCRLRYLGILGPRRRTRHLVDALAPELGLPPEVCMERLHSPVGLDIGAHSPSTIALSIVAELQAVFAGRAIPTIAPRHPVHV